MANVQLSARVKKLAKDFAIIDGKIRLSHEKLNDWLEVCEETPLEERDQLAKDLIALAVKLGREGKEAAAVASAQLYALAAGALQLDGTEKKKGFTAAPKAAAKKPAAAAAPKAKPAAAPSKPAKSSASGGWGPKKG